MKKAEIFYENGSNFDSKVRLGDVMEVILVICVSNDLHVIRFKDTIRSL